MICHEVYRGTERAGSTLKSVAAFYEEKEKIILRKKWSTKIIAALMIMIFAMPTSEMKVQAEEVISTEATDMPTTVSVTTADYNSGVRPLTTMTDCEIVLAFTLNGLEMTFSTSSFKVSSVIGVKDIKVQQKMWKTVMTSDGAENYNEDIFMAGLTYPDAVNGKTYRVTCVHYANYDVYEEVENDTGAFKFVL